MQAPSPGWSAAAPSGRAEALTTCYFGSAVDLFRRGGANPVRTEGMEEDPRRLPEPRLDARLRDQQVLDVILARIRRAPQIVGAAVLVVHDPHRFHVVQPVDRGIALQPLVHGQRAALLRA